MPRKHLMAAGSVLLLAAVALGWANVPDRHPLGPNVWADRVIVDKSDRTLTLWLGGAVLKRYRVALGGEPEGPKLRKGDERTPEGVYRLDYRKADSSAYRALHISYPDSADSARAREEGEDPGGLA